MLKHKRQGPGKGLSPFFKNYILLLLDSFFVLFLYYTVMLTEIHLL